MHLVYLLFVGLEVKDEVTGRVAAELHDVFIKAALLAGVAVLKGQSLRAARGGCGGPELRLAEGVARALEVPGVVIDLRDDRPRLFFGGLLLILVKIDGYCSQNKFPLFIEY